MKTITKNLWRFLSFFALVLVIFGFFSFENSIFLQILIIILALIGLLTWQSISEILVLLILYLGLYDLYNIRYLLAMPLFVVMLAVFGLTLFVFLLWVRFRSLAENLDKNLLWLYGLTTGLISMEIFLAMSFWPVDPKIKSFTIVVIFYVIARLFYLYINSMLNSKKIAIFILMSLLILAAVLVFNMFLFFGL